MSNQTNFFSTLGKSDVLDRAKWRAERDKRSFNARPRFPRIPRIIAVEQILGAVKVPPSLAQVALATQGLANSHGRYIVRFEDGDEALICYDPGWLNFLEYGPVGLGDLNTTAKLWRPQPNVIIASRSLLAKLAPTHWETRRERPLGDFTEVSKIDLPRLPLAYWVTGYSDLAEDLVIAATRFGFRARGVKAHLCHPTRRFPGGHKDGSADFIFKLIGKRQFHIGSVKGSDAISIAKKNFTKVHASQAVRRSVAENPDNRGMEAGFNARKKNCLSLGTWHPDGGTFDSHAFRSVLVFGMRMEPPTHEDAVLKGSVYAPQPSGRHDYLTTNVPIFPIHCLALEG
jgi:hypothetical protein